MSASPHQAEAWRRGHEPRVEYGWHCLTCGEEGTAFSATVAENRAAAHIRDTASGRTPSPLEVPKDVAEFRVMLDAMRTLRRYGYRTVPDVFMADAEKVLSYVSRGRGFVDVEPYPDALARKVLGALSDETAPARGQS
ncbi:MAG: hypothetical protein ACXVYY_01000 [Oryzihumus sp.]